MKVCSNCEKNLPFESFNKKLNGYQPYCRQCDNAKSRERYANNREHHKAVIKKRTIRYRAESKEWIRSLKEENPCVDCGTSYPWYVMDFDHVRGKKSGNISHMVARLNAKQKILDEIEKCEIVCSNCHRERTFKRMGF
jgi:hypothetical protein